MTTTGELARFTEEVSFDELSGDTVEALKRRLLDSVGIAMAALEEQPVAAVRETVLAANGGGDCTLWGTDATSSPVGAAMYNTTLTRYLDFMDSFLAPGETPHPSDNVGTVVAAAEAVDASGRELLEGLGVAYEVQGELAWNAPVRDRGYDHVTHTVISAAAGASKLLDLPAGSIQDAVGIAGTAHNALRVTRTGGINEWKGVAAANAARNGTYAALLAANGMDGPRNLFEGQKGWMEVVSGEFSVHLDPGCGRVHDVMTKRYVAETYAQSAVDGIIELAETHDVDPGAVESIHLDTFAGSKLIIGGGEGSRYEVTSRAQADHSLPYMLAVALIDRAMGLDQYTPERIAAADVQDLLGSVAVEEDESFTERFEAGEMPARVVVTLDDGTTFEVERDDFPGHPNDPMDWDQLRSKFHAAATDHVGSDRRGEIVETIRSIEDHDVADLVALLAE